MGTPQFGFGAGRDWEDDSTLVSVRAHPHQNVRLSVEIRDYRLALGALWKMLQESRSDVHVLEAAAGLRFWLHVNAIPHFQKNLSPTAWVSCADSIQRSI